MSRLILVMFIFLCPVEKVLHAHPSWGIAISANGDIYFADVLHNGVGTVWKLDQQGNVSTVLTDFHAHNLQLDKEGNLWVSEDRWIQGEIEGEGQQTFLKIGPDGKKETLIFTEDRDEFFGGGAVPGFNNDAYFGLNNKIFRKPFEGNTSLLIDHEFDRLVTLYTDKYNNLWITDKSYKNGTLFKWNTTNGLIEYAAQLLPKSPDNPIFTEDRFQLLFGIKVDGLGNVYVCENADRKVLKINQESEVTTFYQSAENWYPAGIAFYKNSAYILEYGYDRKHLGPRIIRLDADQSKTVLFHHK